MPSSIFRGKIFDHFNYVNISPLLSFFTRRLTCWKCGTQHESGLHCSSCKALQEPSKINYFELMNVDVSYDVDAKALVPRYHRLQILYHPDKQSGENEVRLLLQCSICFSHFGRRLNNILLRRKIAKSQKCFQQQ